MMNYFLMLLILLGGLSSCQNTSSIVAPDHTELVRHYFELFNRHEWAQMANMYTEKALFRDPSLGLNPVIQSRAEVTKRYGALAQMVPDVRDSIRQIYLTGVQHVVVEFTSSGTGPDDKKFQLPIITVFKIDNGLISEDLTYYDSF